MRLLAGKIRDHSSLTVILLDGGDTGVLTHERIGAIGATTSLPPMLRPSLN